MLDLVMNIQMFRTNYLKLITKRNFKNVLRICFDPVYILYQFKKCCFLENQNEFSFDICVSEFVIRLIIFWVYLKQISACTKFKLDAVNMASAASSALDH